MESKESVPAYQTDNELIAEFMGWEHCNSPSCKEANNLCWSKDCHSGYISKSDLKFNSSWDWLMPVVEKIEDECFMNVIIECAVVTIEGNLTDQKGIDIAYYTKQTPYQRQEQTKIVLAHEAVVEFIKWYNTQIVTK